MEILSLINSLEELVIQARRLPVGGNLVVDRKRMLDVVDQLRLSVPQDVEEANRVLTERDDILDQAQNTARRILEEADLERERRLAENTLVREAYERSQSMLREAEARAHQAVSEADATAAAHLSEAVEAATRQMDDADEYTLEVLRRLEKQLDAFLDSIRLSIASVQERR